MPNERKEELKENIEKWQEELDTIWAGKETDAAEVERRNLQNLIANAKKEIEEIENPKIQNELGKNFDTLKEKYNEMKKEDASKDLKINRLKARIDKLTDERESYAALKNSSYKDIYDEYTKQIEDAKKELAELEKEETVQEKDDKLATVTQLRMEYEKQIKEKQKEIRGVQREIEDIEFGTEEAMTEKELSDGTKVKTPKILDLYKKKDELEKELKELEINKEECQAFIDQIKGIEEKVETRELSPEEIAYYHGQGDIVENTRDDRRANDEYFGFEKQERKPIPEPTKQNSEKEGLAKKDKDEEPGKEGQTEENEKTKNQEPNPGKEGLKKEDKDEEKQIKEELALAKSGLQIFREQFNEMPEIENKHTASERAKIVAPLLTTAGICSCAIPVVGPFIGIPVAAASTVLKPILYRATGQKKLEKQIENQFSNMDPEEFDRMVDYLSEERIQDLKPNAVILNALHKAMMTRAKQKSQNLQQEKDGLEQEREKILSIDLSNLTPEEQIALNSRLGKINAQLKEISDARAPKIERELKDIKRGKDRVSAAYKGNLKTRFNIFAHRNSTTEEYINPINEYADAELARDKATVRGDNIEAAKHDRKMEEIMDKYTYTDELGIQKGPFNGRNGPVRIMSDKRDETVRNVCVAATLTTGMTVATKNMSEVNKAIEDNQSKFDQIVDAHNQQVAEAKQAVDGIDYGTVQGVADGQVTNASAQIEHTNINIFNNTSTPGYREADEAAQEMIQNVSSKSQITENSVSGMLRQLGDTVKARLRNCRAICRISTNA